MKYAQFWVKFENVPPEFYDFQTFDEFWHHIRERMMRYHNLRIEWIITK